MASPKLVPTVPLLDVNRGNAPLREEILAAITKVVDSGRFLFGPDVQQLEKTVAGLCGVEHAVACASGSDALLLALLALDVGHGDEVIVPSFTFFATASAVTRVGARPVFVDIDPHTFNIDPAHVERAITSRTKAIIPVHLFGQCAEMDELQRIGEREDVQIIEDAAQAIGAAHRGRPAGSLGAIGCLSFYPTKNLGGFGDGGMLTTNDATLAQRLRLFAAHGMSPRYYHQVIGINSRLDTIQAAALNVKLSRLAEWTAQRSANARRYDELFAAAGLAGQIDLPRSLSHCDHVWNQYTIRVPGRRDAVKAQLAEAGVGSEIYYPVPLHLQECYRHLGYKPGSLPATERAAREVLSLPIFPELTADEQHTVVVRLREIIELPLARAA
ncbi:MAG: DegT/DnrJ/EryC1/StrS family aminotransferase [Pirellulaceae bacterium]|nr:DegT/DnrJ/EryC1/StrS family aminotransferase [Pirellulaceae bacterium]